MSGQSLGLAWLSLAQKFLGQASSPPPGYDHAGLLPALHYLERGHAGVLWPYWDWGRERGEGPGWQWPIPRKLLRDPLP